MKIFIVAGEASGDQLGAWLMADLRAISPGVEIIGVGGDEMATQGLTSIFPMSDLSVMGFAEVVPKIPLLLKRIRETAEAIQKSAPDIVVTIDVPDFSKRLARRLQPLRRSGKVKLVHYVAPTVWAWRSGRAKIMTKLFDHLLCVFPFEPPYFTRVGLSASFVGHPVAMAERTQGNAQRLREKLGIQADQPVLCLLPGSRRGEVKKLLPVFLETFQKLKLKNPNWVCVLPTLEHLKETLMDSCLRGNDGVYVVTGAQDKYDAFALAAEQGGAIAASGTVTLELAMAGCPHLVAYRVHPMTYWIVRTLVNLSFVNLINILAEQLIIPEILQVKVTSENLLSEFEKCYAHRMEQTAAFQTEMQKLLPPGSQAAARAVLTSSHV